MINHTLIQCRITVDQRGKIKTGKMGKSKAGKDIPMKLDYFNVDRFPEIIQSYGEKPNKIVIAFATDRIEDVFDMDFVKWGKSSNEGSRAVKTRTCDGVKCVFNLETIVKGKKYGAGEETDCVCKLLDEAVNSEKSQMCKIDVYLKAHIYLPQRKAFDNPVCYLFESHSINTGMNLLSSLIDAKNKYGMLQGVPFLLSVKIVKKNALESYPIWELQPMLPISTVKQMALNPGELEKELLSLPEISQDSVGEELPEVSEEEIQKSEETIHEGGDTIKSQANQQTGGFTAEEMLYEGLSQELDSVAAGKLKNEIMRWKNDPKISDRINKLPAEKIAKLMQLLNQKMSESK